jgi:hypothetical protein
MRPYGGAAIFRQTLAAVRLAGARMTSETAEQHLHRRIEAVGLALKAIGPRDALQAMLGSLAVAAHDGAMQAFARAGEPGTSPEDASRSLRDGANLARCCREMIDTVRAMQGRPPAKVGEMPNDGAP